MSQMPPSLTLFADPFTEVDSKRFRVATRQLVGGSAVVTAGKRAHGQAGEELQS